LEVRSTPASLDTTMLTGEVYWSKTTEWVGKLGRLPTGLPSVPLMSVQLSPASSVR